MKKLLFILGIAAAFGLCATSCGDDDDNTVNLEQYKAWHDENQAWYEAQIKTIDEETGLPFYEEVSPRWATGQTIYMHWFNDRDETAHNLIPELTSTVSTYYDGYLTNGTKFDTSKNKADHMLHAKVSGLIQGWQIALQNMHVGDTVQILVPYQLGYGISGSGSIPPYSVLRFNMRLVDIPNFQTRP